MHVLRSSKIVKLVVVGDTGVGKTCLFTSYTTTAVFPLHYVPSIFDGYAAHHTVDGETVLLGLFDTTGQSDYDRLRPLSYPQTDIFLLCFSLVDPDSYENVRTKWHPELIHYGPTSARIVLVGMKLDLWADPQVVDMLANRHSLPITYSQGAAMARGIGADKYCECSSFTRQGVINIFEEAMRAAICPSSPSKVPKSSCIIV
ncbi:P-loop containing nucleoside triphosphate hydrolase protein [Gymnopilus junonius]|uniref:P-loop containing nucleoside triphosphate hydrolase protein n=1 Tax=Gymnopilus junonius TaxID=109634 RepID=A0A9P5TKR1_GYMJU|nr:P-loop containing nucleoside triphosphate hydrolase protein [Gymnopilus junonius]